MDYPDFQARLKRLGLTLYRMCQDIRLTQSATPKWAEKPAVPGYAAAYVIAMEIMTDEQKTEFRKRLNDNHREDQERSRADSS